MKTALFRTLALLLTICFLTAGVCAEAPAEADRDDWVNFLLICNEGMSNDKGNAGNTLMVVAMNPVVGKIRLLMFTWDTFIDYEGFDVPQKLDMPYRNNGPEESMKVFNDNFGTDISLYMSLNYLNLASMIESYDGVSVDITRAERNALNGMVGSKKAQLQAQVGTGMLTQAIVDMLADEYYLNEFGPNTHLNGLQAVGYGWLQYDSVVNCCDREVRVIGSLFHSVGQSIQQHIAFYTNDSEMPEADEERRIINLDNMTEEDRSYLWYLLSPIFQMSYHNLKDEEIDSISTTLARAAYEASRQGVNIFEQIEYKILPLEANQPYDIVAGAKGHLVDKEANAAAIREFLYQED